LKLISARATATKNPRRETQAGILKARRFYLLAINKVAPLLPALTLFFKAALLEQAEAQADLASLQAAPLAFSLHAAAFFAHSLFSPACNAGMSAKAARVRHKVSFFIVLMILV
jgi:hypothetical protein